MQACRFETAGPPWMAGFKHQGLPGHMVLGAPNLTSTGAGSCTVEMCRQGWELMDRLCPAPTHEPGRAHSQHVDAFQNQTAVSSANYQLLLPVVLLLPMHPNSRTATSKQDPLLQHTSKSKARKRGHLPPATCRWGRPHWQRCV